MPGIEMDKTIRSGESFSVESGISPIGHVQLPDLGAIYGKRRIVSPVMAEHSLDNRNYVT
jgi:hypothetical protein